MVTVPPPDEKTPGEGEHRLVRRVTAVRGSMRFRMECRPAFDYARAPHEVLLQEPNGAIFDSSALTLELAADVPLHGERTGVTADFELIPARGTVTGVPRFV